MILTQFSPSAIYTPNSPDRKQNTSEETESQPSANVVDNI